MKRLALIFILMGIPLWAGAKPVKIIACVQSDDDPDVAKHFDADKKASGIILKDDEEAQGVIEHMNEVPERLVQRYLNRELADIRNGRVVFETLIPNGACAIVEGEPAHIEKITPDILPEPESESVPREALETSRFVIPKLTAAILEDTAWTDERVKQRLERIRKILEPCGVEVRDLEIQHIPNPDHRYSELENDIDDRISMFVSTPFELKLAEILKPLSLTAPALLYLKKVWNSTEPEKICMVSAQAFVRGQVVPKTSPVAGMAIISEAYSPESKDNRNCSGLNDPADPHLVDAHELGHLLLNTGGHSGGPESVMMRGSRFTDEQCASIRGSHFVHREPREKK